MSGRGNEVSLGTNSYNPLILVGLACLQTFHNDYTYWTNSIATLMQLFWTTFVAAGDLSIHVIFSRLEEIINSLITSGVSATETLKDVFAVIGKIFAGALQSTINLWKASELFEIMRGHDTTQASEASSEASSETSSETSSEPSSEASNPSIASNDASEASSKASEASPEATKAAYEATYKAFMAALEAEEEEKATIKAEEKAQSETEAKTEDKVDNTKDYPATD